MNWVYEMWMKNIVVSDAVPRDQVWLVNPGESSEIIAPSGERRVVETKPAQVVKIVGLRTEESA